MIYLQSLVISVEFNQIINQQVYLSTSTFYQQSNDKTNISILIQNQSVFYKDNWTNGQVFNN